MSKGSWREFEDFASIQSIPQSSSYFPKDQRKVRVTKTRGGKNGKTVTVISGLALTPIDAKVLLKALKTGCGTGGVIKGENLELQGDQVINAMVFLEKEGYCPKRSGG